MAKDILQEALNAIDSMEGAVEEPIDTAPTINIIPLDQYEEPFEEGDSTMPVQPRREVSEPDIGISFEKPKVAEEPKPQPRETVPAIPGITPDSDAQIDAENSKFGRFLKKLGASLVQLPADMARWDKALAAERYRLRKESLGPNADPARIKRHEEEYKSRIKAANDLIAAMPEVEQEQIFKSGMMKYVEQGLAGTARFVPLLPVYAANPGVGWAISYGMIYGQDYEDYIAQGYDPKVASNAANLSATLQALVETAGNTIQVGTLLKLLGADKAAGKVASRFVGEAVAKRMGEVAAKPFTKRFMKPLLVTATATIEGFEEVTQAELKVIADEYAKNPSATPEELTRNVIEIWADPKFQAGLVKEQFPPGFVGGLALGTAAGAIGKTTERFVSKGEPVEEAVPQKDTKKKSKKKAEPKRKKEAPVKEDKPSKTLTPAEEETGDIIDGNDVVTNIPDQDVAIKEDVGEAPQTPVFTLEEEGDTEVQGIGFTPIITDVKKAKFKQTDLTQPGLWFDDGTVIEGPQISKEWTLSKLTDERADEITEAFAAAERAAVEAGRNPDDAIAGWQVGKNFIANSTVGQKIKLREKAKKAQTKLEQETLPDRYMNAIDRSAQKQADDARKLTEMRDKGTREDRVAMGMILKEGLVNKAARSWKNASTLADPIDLGDLKQEAHSRAWEIILSMDKKDIQEYLKNPRKNRKVPGTIYQGLGWHLNNFTKEFRGQLTGRGRADVEREIDAGTFKSDLPYEETVTEAGGLPEEVGRPDEVDMAEEAGDIRQVSVEEYQRQKAAEAAARARVEEKGVTGAAAVPERNILAEADRHKKVVDMKELSPRLQLAERQQPNTPAENMRNKLEAPQNITTWYRGQRDVELETFDVGFHMANNKQVADQYFATKKGEKVKTLQITQPLKTIILGDAGAAWDNPITILDSIENAAGYGPLNDVRLEQLKTQINKLRDTDVEARLEGGKLADYFADIVTRAFRNVGIDAVLYENQMEPIEGVNKQDNLSLMVFDKKRITELKEKLDVEKAKTTAPPKKVQEAPKKTAERKKPAPRKTPSEKLAAKAKPAKKKGVKTLEARIEAREKLKAKMKHKWSKEALEKFDRDTELMMEEATKPKDLDQKRQILKDQSGEVNLHILNSVVEGTVNGYNRVGEWLSVEHRFREVPLVGKAMKNIFSRQEVEGQRGIKDAQVFMGLVNNNFGDRATKIDLANIVLAAESSNMDNYIKKWDADYQNKIYDAALYLREWFDQKQKDLQERGMHVDYKKRMLAKLEKDWLEADDYKKAVNITKRIAQLEQAQYIHIPVQVWTMDKLKDIVYATSEKQFKKKWAKMKTIIDKQRQAVSLQSMIDKKLIDIEQVNPVEIMLAYSRRLGHDYALMDIRDAAIHEGMIKVQKTKPKTKGGQWVSIPTRLSALQPGDAAGKKSAWIRYDLLNYLDKAQDAMGHSTKFERFNSLIKMMQFYNPFFLPMYDLVQHAMLTASPATPVKTLAYAGRVPANIVRAFRDVILRTDNYFEAKENGLASKPFNKPMKDWQNTADLITKNSDTNPAAQFRKAMQNWLLSFLKSLSPTKIGDGWFLKPIYEASWNMAWTMDEMVRMMSYNFLREQGHSKQDAAQTAAKFHGDYANVPATTRKTLNKFFFTPTFKIAMSQLYTGMAVNVGRSIMNPKDFVPIKGRKKKTTQVQRRLAYSAAATFAVNVAFHLFMTNMGFEDDELGRRYVKEYYTPQGKREVAITWSSPANMFSKYLFRARTAFGPATDNWIKAMVDMNKWEFHPTYRTAYSIMNNTKPGGGKIWNEFDSFGKQLLDGSIFAAENMIGLVNLVMTSTGLTTQEQVEEARELMLKDIGNTFRVLEHFVFAYARNPKQLRVAGQLKKINNDFSRMIRENAKKGKRLDKKWVENYKKKIRKTLEGLK